MTYNLQIPGWMSELQLQVIERLAQKAKPGGTIVEVGSLYGRSAWCWAKSCDPTVSVYAIDIWEYHLPYCEWSVGFNPPDNEGSGRVDPPNLELTIEQNFLNFTSDCPNIISMKAKSPEDLDQKQWIDKDIDIVFLDQEHINPEFTNNLVFWDKVNPRIICGHDHVPKFPEVMNTVVKWSWKNNRTYAVRYGIWFSYRDDTLL